jgi:hypothetical protein
METPATTTMTALIAEVFLSLGCITASSEIMPSEMVHQSPWLPNWMRLDTRVKYYFAAGVECGDVRLGASTILQSSGRT